jgi:hypothetical protein
MPGKKEDLRNAEADAGPDLTFSYNDLLAELTQEYGLEQRMPGDVSAFDMERETGLTRNWCAEILLKKFRAGKLTKHRVMGENGKSILVYRKRT